LKNINPKDKVFVIVIVTKLNYSPPINNKIIKLSLSSH